MTLSIIFFFLFSSWAAVPPPEAPASPSTLVMYRFHEDSEMTVHGSSNVRDWTMDVLHLDGQIEMQSTDDGAPTVDRLFVEVPVDSVLSDRGSQNEKAHKALQKNAQPVIYFRSETVDVSPASDASSFDVMAEGELIIAGERRNVELRAEGTRLENGAFRFQGEHELLMSDFDIERPTAMLGALRVADEIRITFDVTLVPEG